MDGSPKKKDKTKRGLPLSRLTPFHYAAGRIPGGAILIRSEVNSHLKGYMCTHLDDQAETWKCTYRD